MHNMATMRSFDVNGICLRNELRSSSQKSNKTRKALLLLDLHNKRAVQWKGKAKVKLSLCFINQHATDGIRRNGG
jgi:hypothetical protein